MASCPVQSSPGLWAFVLGVAASFLANVLYAKMTATEKTGP